MDESSSDEDDLPPGVSKSDGRSNQMTQPPVPEKVIVKKGYNPKQSKIYLTSNSDLSRTKILKHL